MSSPQTVTGRWEVQTVDGESVEGGRHPVLELHDDGRLHGRAINVINGTYTYIDGVLSTGPLMTTLMAGPPEQMAREARILAVLGQAVEVTGSDDVIELVGADGRLTLVRTDEDDATL
jgi:heat shock protein HslJ